MKSKASDSKEIIKKITSNEYKLEELLSNSTLIQADIKPKFGKLTSFFCTDEVLHKLLNYSLHYETTIEDFEHLSHNSCELLAAVKNQAFLEKLISEAKENTVSETIIEGLESTEKVTETHEENLEKSCKKKRFPFLDHLFEYAYDRQNLIRCTLKKMVEGADSEEVCLNPESDPIIDELLSGYFTRIFSNLIQQRKDKVIK